MSGLVSFFKDFFPNVQNIDYSRRLEDLTADERGIIAISPSSAKEEKKKKKSESHHDAALRQSTADNRIITSEERLVKALSKPPPQSLVECTPNPVTFREWRKYNKESLLTFYGRRLRTEDEDMASDDDNDDNVDDEQQHEYKHSRQDEQEHKNDNKDDGEIDDVVDGDDDNDEEKKDEDFWESDSEAEVSDQEDEQHSEPQGGNKYALDSQPLLGGPPLAAAPAAQQQQQRQQRQQSKHHKIPPSKRRIPPLYQAIHSIHTLEYLDLRTKDLSLDLCQVRKVWRLRETRRGLEYMKSSSLGNYKTRCVVFPGRMPRVLFGHLQDDGPMASAYDFVLSLEVEQLLPVPKSRQHGGTPRKAIVRIFLYNSYAKAVSEWMENQTLRSNYRMGPRKQQSQQHQHRFILQLSNIPAVSIFPYALDPRDWWDQEHVVKYCLCLGDGSNLGATDSQEGTTTEIRADSDDMEFRLAVAIPPDDQDERKNASELVISKRMIQDPIQEDANYDDDDDVVDDNIQIDHGLNLHPLLNSWKSYWESKKASLTASALPPPPTTTTTAADPGVTATITTQENQQQLQEKQQQERSTNMIGPPPPPAMPNFSTTGTTSAAADPPAPANDARMETTGPQIPLDRPPPPSPVNVPTKELMAFHGDARKRPYINDVTNLPSLTTGSLDVEYTTLLSLRTLCDNNRREDGRLFNPNLTVNLYAVIMGFTVPSQTKRGDWMVMATLVDETCTVPISLIMFTKSIQDLPKFQRMGDVLRLHRVQLQTWKGDVQLTGRKSSSYVVIRKRSDVPAMISTDCPTMPWDVVPTATKEYSFEEWDERRSQNLWHWGQKLLRDQPTMIHGTDHRFKIADLSRVDDEDLEQIKDRDLTVMVTSKIPFPTDALTGITARGFVRVWDGTGSVPSDPLPIPTPAAHASVRTGDPPSEALTKLASIVAKCKANPKDDDDDAAAMADLETPHAVCGKLANVVIWENAHWELLNNHVPIGSFIRLRNVEIKQWNDHSFRSFLVHPKSWLTPLPDETYEIRKLLLEHDRRVKRSEYNPLSGILPISDDEQEASGVHQTTTRPNYLPPVPQLALETPDSTSTGLIVGNGLADFIKFASKKPAETSGHHRKKKRRKVGTMLEYTGVVRLSEPTIPKYNRNLNIFCTGTPPNYRFVLTVSDESNEALNVIVSSPVADKLIGVSAEVAAQGGEWRDPLFEPDEALARVTLRGMIKGNVRYFVMTDVRRN